MRQPPSNEGDQDGGGAPDDSVRNTSRLHTPSGLIVDEQGNPFPETNHTQKPSDGVVKKILFRMRLAESLNVVLTAIIACSTVMQYLNSSKNNQATGKQVDRLICAASGVNEAAHSFSTSAQDIDLGIGNAVKTLAQQAATMEASLILNQRPWLGLTQFHEASVPVPSTMGSANGPPMQENAVIVPTVRNTGRTPARNVEVVYETLEIGDNYTAAINDPRWMTRLIEDSISGKFDGVQTITNRHADPPLWMGNLSDQSYFPANTGRRVIDPPKHQAMGVLPPDGAAPLKVEQTTILTNAPNAPQNAYITFGKIIYRDVWGMPRETVFCSYTPNRFRSDLTACPVYNDMQ